MTECAGEIAAVHKVLDDFMPPFNARDLDARANAFNFPRAPLASRRTEFLEANSRRPEMVSQGALVEGDHSPWERRAVIHPSKGSGKGSRKGAANG